MFLDSKKLSKNCCAFETLLNMKNVMASLLDFVDIIDPCDDATSIIYCTLLESFPNKLVDFVLVRCLDLR